MNNNLNLINMNVAFICKGLSTQFYDKLENLETLEQKYQLLKTCQNGGLNIVSCIGSHGLLSEQMYFNIRIKNGAKFTEMKQSKGTSKKTITFKFN
jgi:hypothetical protein